MRETILSGCIDKVRSMHDDESHVDIDQLIIDYLSETDEETDGKMEVRKKQKEWEANVLARNALEEFERLVDDEN